MIIVPVTVIFAYLTLSVYGKKFHEHLTKEEIESVFNVKPNSINQVEYEVVPIFHFLNLTKKERAERPPIHAYLETTTKNYNFYLEDNDLLLGSNTPIHWAQFNPKNSSVPRYLTKLYKDYFNESLGLYHDYKNQAAFAVHKDINNNRHFDGFIENDIIVRSLPDQLHNRLISNSAAMLKTITGLDNLTETSFSKNFTIHVLMDSKKQFNNVNDQIKTLNTERAKLPSPKLSLKKPFDTVYPEILVTVDYETYKLHGNDIKKIAKYIAAFWNAVDLRYRTIQDPKVRLNIAGLIIPESPNAVAYYMKNNIIKGHYDPYKILSDMYVYFDAEMYFASNKYDVVFSMTNRKFGNWTELKNKKKVFDTNITTNGLAYVGTACNYKRSGLIFDTGGFDGIKTGAHELAHLFSSRHDPKDVNKTTINCHWDEGYIMSYNIKTHKSFEWSPCTKNAMKAFFKSEKSSCLRNKPNVGRPYPKLLPGRLLSRNDQCLKYKGTPTSPSKIHKADCLRLWCNVPDNPPYVNYWGSPAEGTSCGDGKICLDGYCVSDSSSYLRK